MIRTRQLIVGVGRFGVIAQRFTQGQCFFKGGYGFGALLRRPIGAPQALQHVGGAGIVVSGCEVLHGLAISSDGLFIRTGFLIRTRQLIVGVGRFGVIGQRFTQGQCFFKGGHGLGALLDGAVVASQRFQYVGGAVIIVRCRIERNGLLKSLDSLRILPRIGVGAGQLTPRAGGGGIIV